MNEEWGLPISKNKIVDRRNRLIEYRNIREIRTIPLSRVIDENILSINYMIYEIERLNNIIKEIKDYFEDLEIFAPSRDIKYDILDIIEGSENNE